QRSVPASRVAMLKLVDGLVRPRSQKTTDTTVLLRNALTRLEKITAITTIEELQLAQRVERIGAQWGKHVFKRPRIGKPTERSCLVCSSTLLGRRCGCGGWLTEQPAEAGT